MNQTKNAPARDHYGAGHTALVRRMQEAARDYSMAGPWKVRRARNALASALCEEFTSYLAAEKFRKPFPQKLAWLGSWRTRFSKVGFESDECSQDLGRRGAAHEPLASRPSAF